MSIKKKHMITVVLLIAVAFTGFIAYRHRIQNSKITYKDHLDDVVVQVNDRKLTLKDAAYYVAYEEKTVEEQAVVYDPDNTNKYWNLHIDGEFVRVAASNAVVNMLIHDEIFYELAVDDGIELTQEDIDAYENSESDFWSDLTDIDGQSALGITEDDLKETMKKAALAQKYQEIYAQLQNAETTDYDVSGDGYKALLEKTDYKINEKLWDRVDIGNVTLSH